MQLSLQYIIKNLPDVQVIAEQQEVVFEEIAFDSRKYIAQNSLFICLATTSTEIQKHIFEAAGKASQWFLVPEFYQSFDTDKNYLVVSDVLRAIQNLAKVYRNSFQGKVIGVTGSNGKTIIKEWLDKLLQVNYHTCKSPGSYNSQLGVPLSILQCDTNADIWIIEAGISQVGEMDVLQDMIQPNIGILTNIGDAHDEGFESKNKKLEEKLQLFKSCPTLFIQTSEKLNPSLIKNWYTGKILDWSFVDKQAYFRAKESLKNGDKSIQLSAENTSSEWQIPFTDPASTNNSVFCILVALELGVSYEQIQEQLNKLESISMRLTLLEGKAQSLIINDSYNADLTSLENALHYAKMQGQERSIHLVLTPFDQLGTSESVIFRLNEILQEYPIEKVYYISENRISGLDFKNIEYFQNIEQIQQAFLHYIPSDALFLIKGARRFHLERLLPFLGVKAHRTRLQVSLDNIVHNLSVFKQRTKKDTKIMAVIKAAAYGSNSIRLAKLLENKGVDYFAVAYFEEALELRRAHINTPIMIMNPDPIHAALLEHYQLELEIYSLQQLQQFTLHSRVGLRVHLKLDTGMHRLGFATEELDALFSYLNEHPEIKVVSIFSHFACADNPKQDQYTHEQHAVFQDMITKCRQAIKQNFFTHICNSNGALRFPEYHYNMIRLGIGLYGYLPDSSFKLAHRLSSYIAQIKQINAGDSVGYNRSFISTDSKQIATTSIGYADGLSRSLGNGNISFKINKQKVKTLGNISMDTCSIDLSGIDAKIGDEIVIFETYEEFHQLLEAQGMIAYEFLTQLGPRVHKVYTKE